MTSQAKANEVLDVIHAVEFSKTAPRVGLPTKKASRAEALQKSIPPYQLRLEGLLQLCRGWTLTCAAVSDSRRMIAVIA